MADLHIIDVRLRVTVATHASAGACRRELREVIDTAFAPLREHAFNQGPTGAIDNVVEYTLNTRLSGE